MKTISIPSPKEFPTKIYFGSEVYKIVYKKNFKCYGETDWSKKTITIKKGLSHRQFLATIVHELLHVIEAEFPVKLKHKTVYKLESAIVSLLLDNFL